MTTYAAQASGSTAVDLSKLPAPDVVEALSYEGIVAALKAELVSRMPSLEPVLQLESEPLVKLIQIFAVRELMLRQRVNDAAKAVLVAYARGADLDHLAALFGIVRLELAPADAEAQTPAVMEGDEELRRRVLMAPEGYSVAGPEGAYVSHALNASGDVLDASATSPNPGEVLVTVLARPGPSNPTGVPDADLLDLVEAAVSAEDVRPLTDMVTVAAADVVDFEIEATVTTFAGPDSALVMAEANARLDRYLADAFKLGRDVTRSSIIAALSPENVQNVDLVEPSANVVVTRLQAARCTARSVTHAGLGE